MFFGYFRQKKSKNFKNFIDKAIFPIALAGPIMTVPQLLKVWIEKDAGGLSIITWVSLAIVAVFWITYGMYRQDIPIVLANVAWLTVEIGIIAGILIYG